MRFWLFSCFILLATSNAIADDVQDVGLVFEGDQVFSVKAPEGWLLDNKAGNGKGLQAVFYPAGSTWTDAKATMYANIALRTDNPDVDVQKFIDFEIGHFKESSPKVQTSDLPKITIADKKEAFIKKFTGESPQKSEAVAYIEEPGMFVLIVLTALSPEAFDKSYPAFENLIHSYKPLTEAEYKSIIYGIARTNLNAEPGRSYGKNASVAFWRRHKADVRACLEKSAPTNRKTFQILSQLGPNGETERMLFFPETPIALCLKSNVLKDSYPKPPALDWWIVNRVSFQE